MYAVEKAEQIESNASKLYDLEMKRLRLLYKQWEDVVVSLGNAGLSEELQNQVVKISSTIAQVLEQNSKVGVNMIRKDLHKNSDNYVRSLLNKMDYAINTKPKQTSKQVLSSMSAETEKENARIIDLSGKLDKIKATGKGSMADNYLNSEEDLSSPFASTLVKGKSKHKKSESGFDLEDALNPKEDLDEIMRAFDFFIDENDDK
jgi:predicted RNA-binding protein Jag